MFRNLSTVGLPLSGRPSELIELALSFGFDAMDIDILDFQQQADVYGVTHARRLMVSARLKSGVFHLPVQLGADDATFEQDMAALPKRLELAEATEAPRAVARLEPASDEHSFKDFFELHPRDCRRSATCSRRGASASAWRSCRRPRLATARRMRSSTPTRDCTASWLWPTSGSARWSTAGRST